MNDLKPKWHAENIRTTDWRLSVLLIIAGLIFVLSSQYFDYHYLSVIGAVIQTVTILWLCIKGRSLLRFRLSPQQLILMDTSPEGAEFRNSLHRVTVGKTKDGMS